MVIVAAPASPEKGRPSGHVGQDHDGPGHGGCNRTDQDIPVSDVCHLMGQDPHDLLPVHEFQQTLGDRLEKQGTDQSALLRAAQQELVERSDKQNTEQAAQLRAVHKDLSERIEQLATDLLTQLRTTQKELGDRIDRVNAEYSERVRALQAETRQRDDSLRQELLTLASSLEDKKTSRHDLGQMLMELGQRLRSETDLPARPR